MPQLGLGADDEIRHHASEDDLAPEVEMRHILTIVAPVVRPRGVAADGVDVGQARAVEVDDGRARHVGRLDGRQALVVQRVRGVVRICGEDAAREGRDEELGAVG